MGSCFMVFFLGSVMITDKCLKNSPRPALRLFKKTLPQAGRKVVLCPIPAGQNDPGRTGQESWSMPWCTEAESVNAAYLAVALNSKSENPSCCCGCRASCCYDSPNTILARSRQFWALLFQLPPRLTRLEPLFAPGLIQLSIVNQ